MNTKDKYAGRENANKETHRQLSQMHNKYKNMVNSSETRAVCQHNYKFLPV